MSAVIYTPQVCKIVNAKSHIHMSGKRGKKTDSEVNGIRIFLKTGLK